MGAAFSRCWCICVRCDNSRAAIIGNILIQYYTYIKYLYHVKEPIWGEDGQQKKKQKKKKRKICVKASDCARALVIPWIITSRDLRTARSPAQLYVDIGNKGATAQLYSPSSLYILYIYIYPARALFMKYSIRVKPFSTGWPTYFSASSLIISFSPPRGVISRSLFCHRAQKCERSRALDSFLITPAPTSTYEYKVHARRRYSLTLSLSLVGSFTFCHDFHARVLWEIKNLIIAFLTPSPLPISAPLGITSCWLICKFPIFFYWQIPRNSLFFTKKFASRISFMKRHWL